MKILFIGGAGRSGSTLLEMLLGQIDGVASVGEINEIWKAGVLENRLCGCGAPFGVCDFWRSVLRAGFGETARIDIKRIVSDQASARIRNIPLMRWPHLQSRTYARRLQAHRESSRLLLEGIQKASGARLIVDSSKTPSQAFMLSTLANTELHILQLVRDSRAVAHSWGRRRKIPDSTINGRNMTRMSPVQSSADWLVRHFFLETIKRAKATNVVSYNVVRYEDLVAEPASTLSQILQPVGMDFDPSTLFKGKSVVRRRRTTHTIEGNPTKFEHGDIRLQLDAEWERMMPFLNKALVSAVTLPYLRKFKYV